jgi:hypothetical protein
MDRGSGVAREKEVLTENKSHGIFFIPMAFFV